jgi:indole-3-glycerol phosphate synthase
LDSSEPHPDILEEIVRARCRDVETAKRSLPLESLATRARRRKPRDFRRALSGSGMSIIAEMKKASPSAGVLRREYLPSVIARGYERAGAAALSVLTEPRFFDGDLRHIAEARRAVALPVLRKDFIVDEYQITEAAAAGADAVLLVARILTARQLATFVEQCDSLRLSPLVEIYDEEDVGKAKASGAEIIGINNRDLRSMRVSIERTLTLAPLIPPGRIIVSESGIRGRDDLARLMAAGVRAALIGESLLTEEDPGLALARMLRR